MKIITIARKPLSESNVASNVLKHGCGAIDIDSCRIESGTEHHRPPQPTNQERSVFGKQAAFAPTNSNLGRWPSNVLLDDSPEIVGLFPDAKSSFRTSRNHQGGLLNWKAGNGLGHNDRGSAARFFKQFKVDK